MTTMPYWLVVLSIVSLALAGICVLAIALDIIAGRRQRMAIMNLVWPITALYSGPLGLWAYWRLGRAAPSGDSGTARRHDMGRAALRSAASQPGMPNMPDMPDMPNMGMKREDPRPAGTDRPFWQRIVVATTHCGSGCTVGDIVGVWLLHLFPLTLFGRRIFAEWIVDYFLALLFGIAFQYSTIKPMRSLSAGEALRAAFKADVLSLTAWQIGMYGWMALVTFVIFGRELDKSSPVFWFMMQLAMLAGFLTSYPMNWWLVRAGIKHAM